MLPTTMTTTTATTAAPENGEKHKDEIEEEGGSRTRMRLSDYIPVYIPAVEQGLMTQSQHREERFLDFLRARPSGDWFRTASGSPFAFLRRGGRRFRVPFVRKISWRGLLNSFKKWIRDPANIATFIWLVLVFICLFLLLLLMAGILNGAIPSSTRRKKWTEVVNQILNALFTIISLYYYPRLLYHLVLILRWRPADRPELRRVYCKDAAPRPRERLHLMVVVSLLHITCFAQFFCCALFWAYNRHNRPSWALNLGYGIGSACPIIAGIYTARSPLGRKYDEPAEEESAGRGQAAGSSDQTEFRIYNRRVVVTSPEWIGGLFDCWDDVTVFCLSSLCTFCVFGWNMERLGFGNMYVHICTFALLCIAPFLIFGISALNIHNDTIQEAVEILGIVVGVFGLLYGGYWRIQMRKRFKLPPNPYCCGRPSVTDCVQWLFCWPCSLAQEVRTGNFYDVEEDKFCRKMTNEEGRPVLVPLPREGGASIVDGSRSFSCPPKLGPSFGENLNAGGGGAAAADELHIAFERSSTYGGMHTMRPPLPPLIQFEDK